MWRISDPSSRGSLISYTVYTFNERVNDLNEKIDEKDNDRDF